MEKNRGLIFTKLLPIILLLGILALTALVLGQKTGFFNRAAPLTTPITPPTGITFIVDFIPTQISGIQPLRVRFTNNSSSLSAPIVSYQWNFGDGKTSTKTNPSHTFKTKKGMKTTYKVILKAKTALGETKRASGTVTVFPN